MKKKFNLYCGLLIAAIVFGIGIDMSKSLYTMYYGGKTGWEFAKKEHEMGVKRDPYWVLNFQQRMVPVEMMPLNVLLEPTDSIVNKKTGEKMPIMTAAGIVFPKEPCNRMRVMQGFSYIGLVFVIIFWIAFIRLVVSVNKGSIFEQSTERQLAWGGWGVFGIYVIGWVQVLINYFQNVEMFEFEGYTLFIGNTPDHALLYSAFGMLLIGQIFKIGRQMKEEQELTI